MDGIMDGLLQFWMELFTNYFHLSGYNWESIGNPNIGDDSCDCENGGVCWPLVAGGRDAIGIAETGSGKTLAFSVPGLQHLAHRKRTEAKVGKKWSLSLSGRCQGKN